MERFHRVNKSKSINLGADGSEERLQERLGKVDSPVYFCCSADLARREQT